MKYYSECSTTAVQSAAVLPWLPEGRKVKVGRHREFPARETQWRENET